jgi:hypothetical protein
MTNEQQSQSQQKTKGPFVVCETKGSPPPEPVNAFPFVTNPQSFQKGLSSPPIEPVNISPFQAKPAQQSTTNKATSETTE